MNAEQDRKPNLDGGLRQSDLQPTADSSDVSRRAILNKAGWAVPVIVAVILPNEVLAGSRGRVGIDRDERSHSGKTHEKH
jgi:hypothetical protein